MAYQVMLGAPTPEIESQLIAGFEELPDAQLISVHRSSKEVIETVPQLSELDVVLIHEDLGPLPVLDLIRDLSRSYPQLAVILLVSAIEPDTFTQAMEAGARGVLPATATVEELNARITTAADWSRTLRRHLEAASLDLPMSGSQGAVVAITGGKGGVGTTTIAIQTALTAAKGGRKVCLVDLDLQMGDIPGFMDLNHRRSIVDLVEAADNISAAMLSDTLYVHPDGVHVLLAPGEGEQGEDVKAGAARQILGALRSRYEIVIIDCGSSMTEASAMAVELADTALVAVTPDLPAIRGAQRLVAMWDRLQVRKKSDVTAILTRHSRKNEIQPDFVRKLLGTPLLKNVLPANYRALEEAGNTGDPLRLTDDAFRKAFRLVADELGLLSAPEEAPSQEPKGSSRKLKLSGKKGDSGVALVEFAALIPLFVFICMVAWQFVLVGLTSMYASHAASEGARQAAVTPYNEQKIDYEARKRVDAKWKQEDQMTVDVARNRPDGDFVQVSIKIPVFIPGYNAPIDIGAESRIVPEGQ